MTTVALVAPVGGAPDALLLGKAVWQRTLAATRRARPRRVVWLGDDAPPGMTAVTLRLLGRGRGPLLIVPAELALVTESSLARLARTGRRARAPQRLAGSDALYVPSVRGIGSAGSAAEIGQRLAPSLVYPEDEDELLRVGDFAAIAKATSVLRRRKVEALLRRGVRIHDPATVYVDPEVVVGKGTELHPFVLLQGETRIGTQCTIASFSHVVDSVVGAGTVLLDHCFVRASRIGKRASVGPFAHLRPESDVGTEARVGNFVELKNTRLGDGAKAPHLSYLGDAVVGKRSNIGAGTITCNYDGVRKHRTVVGDGAFIGSDVQLVAPVRVGRGAFVAAGSCIVEDVPANALAVARSRQTTKRGWARKKREGR